MELRDNTVKQVPVVRLRGIKKLSYEQSTDIPREEAGTQSKGKSTTKATGTGALLHHRGPGPP